MTPLPAPALDRLRDRWLPRPSFESDPVAWADDKAIELWSKQREILEALVGHEQVAVPSCHSAGKSFTAAQATAWWLDSHPRGSAFVVTTAPTGAQVKAILWREINRVHGRLDLFGRTNMTEWYDDTGELVAFGRKPNDYEPTAFQGIHAEFVLVILDEACGIPESLWDAASSLTSNEGGRILAIGNPDDPESHFAKICYSPTWHTIRISAMDTPNVTGEGVSDFLRRQLVSMKWIEQRKLEWGEESSVFQSKVLGLFPSDAEDGVVPYSWASRCQLLDLEAIGDVELGVDVSGGGADRTVVWARQGAKALGKWEKSDEKDSRVLALWIAGIIRDTGAVSVKVDATGVGWGVCGILDELHAQGEHDAITTPVMVGEAADDPDEYLNKRAEMWWAARERSREGTWDLSALTDDDLAELTTPRWHTNNPKQRIQIEKKADLKKRLNGKSPDSADALLLAFHEEVFEAVSLVGQMAGARMVP